IPLTLTLSKGERGGRESRRKRCHRMSLLLVEGLAVSLPPRSSRDAGCVLLWWNGHPSWVGEHEVSYSAAASSTWDRTPSTAEGRPCACSTRSASDILAVCRARRGTSPSSTVGCTRSRPAPGRSCPRDSWD